jgi:tRNA(Ile)-lysidine synthase
LKKLFQEHGIPPWERERVPLIKIDGKLAAVADLWICIGVNSDTSTGAIELSWNRKG